MKPWFLRLAGLRPAALAVLAAVLPAASAAPASSLTLHYESPHWLLIRGEDLPGREIRINYLEAYCRADSTEADWVKHTVIPHRVEVISLSDDRSVLRLRDTLADGVTVEHTVTAGADEVDFRLLARNPGPRRSEAQWAQPCVRLGAFTGYPDSGGDLDDYLPKAFVVLNGKVTRLPDVKPWTKDARYTPGQTWCPHHVPRSDVNPRPLSPLVPDLGLIGAFSADEKWVFATAWEPYQELFQGVARCLHSDFRLGGLESGETREIRGKIYVVTNDLPALQARYARDFPTHAAGGVLPGAGRPSTSMSLPETRYTVPPQGYAVLARGDWQAVVVDNRAVDDAVLPGHRAGYHGVAALRHARQPRSLFVPAYAGLNFEHIHDGTVQAAEVLFEPRRAPMELRVIDAHTVDLYQPPTPFWGLESCQRYQLREDGVIELTFECVPRRDRFRQGYLGLFWASYIDRPESLDVHFRGLAEGEARPDGWLRGVTPKHGVQATHRAVGENRVFPHDPAFPLELPFGFSSLRYGEPWFFGVCRDMAFVQMFRPEDRVWLSQSPSGGGAGCPAWDFQWHVPRPKVGERYQLKMRALYMPLSAAADQEAVRAQVRSALRGVRFTGP